MTDPLRFVPPRVQLVDPANGMISREWYLFFQGVFDRIGGAMGSSTPDIVASLFEDAGSSETNALLFSAEQASGQTPSDTTPQPDTDVSQLPYLQFVQVEALQTELSDLRETVAELKKALDELRQGTMI